MSSVGRREDVAPPQPLLRALEEEKEDFITSGNWRDDSEH